MAGSSLAQVFLVSACRQRSIDTACRQTFVPVHLLVDFPRRHEEVRKLPCREFKVLRNAQLRHGPTPPARTICGNRVKRFNSTLPRDDSPRVDDDPPVEMPNAGEPMDDAPKRGCEGRDPDETPWLVVGSMGAFIVLGERRIRIRKRATRNVN